MAADFTLFPAFNRTIRGRAPRFAVPRKKTQNRGGEKKSGRLSTHGGLWMRHIHDKSNR